MWPVIVPSLLAAALIGAAHVLPANAQDTPTGQGDNAGVDSGPVAPMADGPPILTLDQERMFQDSAWGRAAIALAEENGRALAAENRQIDEALEKEERALTERRATMPAEDFAALAVQFDTKVEEIRTAQDAKSRAITRNLEEDRQRFFEAATPVLGELLAETGAVAILADSAIIMSLTTLDITDAAIARIDTALPPTLAAPADDAPAGTSPSPQSNP